MRPQTFDDFVARRRSDISSGRLSEHEKSYLFEHLQLSPGLNFESTPSVQVENPNQLPALSQLETFADLDVHAALANNLAACGYKHFTPVQKESLRFSLNNVDMLTCAQTGSGKTVAFLIPMLQHCLQNTASQSQPHVFFPKALVLTPTRELAKQVFVQAVRLAFGTGVRPALVYGGASKQAQLGDLRRHGVDLLDGTPGRVNDLIESKEICLNNCGFFVLDEADRMLDMGFIPQIRNVLSNGKVRNIDERQTLFFSATFPREIEELTGEFLGRKKRVKLTIGKIGSVCSDITQQFLQTDRWESKIELLEKEIARVSTKILVFVNKKRDCEEVARAVRVRAATIHGDKMQMQRDRALESFKEGKVRVLVATDVAARGLDIPHVDLVVNFDLAPTAEDHVHRVGRTGRAGNKGEAVTFVGAKENKNLGELVKLLRKEKIEVPAWMERMSRFSAKPSFNRFRRYR